MDCLNCKAQRTVAISGTKSTWRPVTISVFQELILAPDLFNIFINDMDGGVKSTLSKLAEDTKLGVVANTQACVAIQTDLKRLEKGADMNLMKYNQVKCKVLHLVRDNPTQ